MQITLTAWYEKFLIVFSSARFKTEMEKSLYTVQQKNIQHTNITEMYTAQFEKSEVHLQKIEDRVRKERNLI